MKNIVPIVIICLYFNTASAQEVNKEIPIHYIKQVKWIGEKIEYPAYIDSSLFARYIDWNLQPDSLPIAVKPDKGSGIEIWYVVSKEGKISLAKSPRNEKNALTDFILQKLMDFPYQWSPTYQNGRPVNSYHKIKFIF